MVKLADGTEIEWSEMIEAPAAVLPRAACNEAIEWAEAQGPRTQTIDCMIAQNAGWALWGNRWIDLWLSDEQFAACARGIELHQKILKSR